MGSKAAMRTIVQVFASLLQSQPALELKLSRKQLWALIDCVDAFRKIHPDFAPLVFNPADAPNK
jgi:hypothetical protein